MWTTRPRLARGLARVVIGVGLAASVASAQRIWVGGGRVQPKWAKLESFDGSYNYCRGSYTSDRGEYGGSGWWTDYPGSDNNFSVRLGELTNVHVKMAADGQPDFVVIPLTSPLLFHCPILMMEDVGTARFNEEEAAQLREYLLKGGFLWVDDFWGSLAWEQWLQQIARVLPANDYPVFDIPRDHSIMHALYDVKEIPQVSSISFWYRSGGHTSERGADSAVVTVKGIQDANGRLMVLMTHNTDIADTWEREGESKEYFALFSPAGYAVGVNVILYAMSH